MSTILAGLLNLPKNYHHHRNYYNEAKLGCADTRATISNPSKQLSKYSQLIDYTETKRSQQKFEFQIVVQSKTTKIYTLCG